MMTMQWKYFNDLHGAGLFLVGVVIRQQGVHVFCSLEAVVERVVATVDCTVLGCGSREGLDRCSCDAGYLASLLVFR